MTSCDIPTPSEVTACWRRVMPPDDNGTPNIDPDEKPVEAGLMTSVKEVMVLSEVVPSSDIS